MPRSPSLVLIVFLIASAGAPWGRCKLGWLLLLLPFPMASFVSSRGAARFVLRRVMLASSSSALVVVSALALASLSVSSCGGHTSPCCCHTGRSVVLPPSAVAPIASVSTDGSCGASDGGGEPGARHVDVSRHSAGTRRPGGARGRRYVRIHRRIRRDEQECGLRHADCARRRLCPRARRRRALPRLGRRCGRSGRRGGHRRHDRRRRWHLQPGLRGPDDRHRRRTDESLRVHRERSPALL